MGGSGVEQGDVMRMKFLIRGRDLRTEGQGNVKLRTGVVDGDERVERERSMNIIDNQVSHTGHPKRLEPVVQVKYHSSYLALA